MRILNLGSGKNRSIPGAVTIGIVADTSPDIVHDLNKFPWPFDDDTFEAIHCMDVIEHLEDVVRTMEEMHRISRVGARVYIATPHFSCANSYTDPTHRHHLGFFSFDLFTGHNQWRFYSYARFKKVKADLVFSGWYKNRHISWVAQIENAPGAKERRIWNLGISSRIL